MHGVNLIRLGQVESGPIIYTNLHLTSAEFC